MKTLVQKPTSILWVVLVGLLAFTSFDSKAQQAEVSFQIFYDELAPHGRWLLHPKYGDVWAPNVQGEFTPYLTNGYWTVTQYGNTWVSNYDWGWATFHYGRWYFDEFEGWVWIPDTVWAPAWVVWRNGGGYYGWAAMAPGINFNVSFTLFDGIPGNYWCFVPQQYVWRPYLYRYCAPRHRNVYIVSNTTYVTHCSYNNVTYNYYTGPSHTEITHVTNRPVVIHHVEHTNKPGRSEVSRDKIVMFTPVVKRSEIDRPSLDNLGSNNGWGKGPVRDGNGNDQGNGGNGNNGGQGNNGHGNGDDDAPGNSGGNNNGENSENSGQGNSGKGKGENNGSRWSSSNSSDRTNNSNDNFENWKRQENNKVRSYRSTEIQKSSNTGSGSNRSGWSNSGGSSGRSFSSGSSGNSGGNTKSYTPSRSNSSSGGNRSYTPSNSGSSGSSGKSYSPSRSSGNSGNSNRSFTPSRSSGSSSGGSKTITPSRSSDGSSNNSSKSKSKN